MTTPLYYQSPLSLNPRDAEHLNLLAIFSYIWGALALLGGCIGFIYIFMGTFFINNTGMFAGPPGSAPPPKVFGWFFVIFGGVFVLIGWAAGGLMLYSARSIQLRKRRILSLVMAGISCLSIPLGTTLGVFTFIVLLRESVANLYKAAEMDAGRLPPG